MAVVIATSLPSIAEADTPRACAQAYEKSQEERKAGKLRAALESLTECAAQTCPAFLRKDCIQWLTETERALPSTVFAVRRNGSDLTDVTILCDGDVVAESIDGKAIALDPGAHELSFRIPGSAPIQKQVVIREGEHNRIVQVEVNAAPPSAFGADVTPGIGSHRPISQSAPSTSRGNRLAYGLAGMGLLGVTGFAAFAGWGYSQKVDLESSCAPSCQSSQVDQVRTKYIIADVSLAVGVLSAGLAVYLFASSGSSPSGTAVAITPARSGQGGVLDIATTF